LTTGTVKGAMMLGGPLTPASVPGAWLKFTTTGVAWTSTYVGKGSPAATPPSAAGNWQKTVGANTPGGTVSVQFGSFEVSDGGEP
jgi:hypothetical protein